MKQSNDLLGTTSGRRLSLDADAQSDGDGDEPDQIQQNEPTNFRINRSVVEDKEGSDGENSYSFDDSLGEHDEDEIDSESGLSELSNEEDYFNKKASYQMKGLFDKNLSLQLRAKGTNLMQVMTPLVGLLLVFMVSFVGEKDAQAMFDQQIFSPLPYFFGLNYKPLTNFVQDQGPYVDNCDKWVMTGFADNAT